MAAKCGTPSGYKAHIRKKERTCDQCRIAHNAYNRALRARHRVTTIPLGVGVHTEALNKLVEWVTEEDSNLLALFAPDIAMLSQFATMFDGVAEVNHRSVEGEEVSSQRDPAIFREWRQLLATTHREIRGFLVAKAKIDQETEGEGKVVELSTWQKAMGATR